MLVNSEGCFKLISAVKVWKYNIVFFRDTWYNENIIENELYFEDYTIHRKDQPAKCENKHAVELIGIENIICCHKIKILNDGFLFWGTIVKGSLVYICFLYSPPKNSPYGYDVEKFQIVLKLVPHKRIFIPCWDPNLWSKRCDMWNNSDEYENNPNLILIPICPSSIEFFNNIKNMLDVPPHKNCLAYLTIESDFQSSYDSSEHFWFATSLELAHNYAHKVPKNQSFGSRNYNGPLHNMENEPFDQIYYTNITVLWNELGKDLPQKNWMKRKYLSEQLLNKQNHP